MHEYAASVAEAPAEPVHEYAASLAEAPAEPVHESPARAAVRKGMSDWLDAADVDVLTLQEVRAEASHLAAALPGWHIVNDEALAKGRAGDASAAREPLDIWRIDLGDDTPDLPMLAALSAAHLAAILFPDTLRRLYIVRDNDPAGDAARDTLIERADAGGIEAIVISPQLGDFNEDLRSLGLDTLSVEARLQVAPQDVARFMALAT